jgi:hypothetical protein
MYVYVCVCMHVGFAYMYVADTLTISNTASIYGCIYMHVYVCMFWSLTYVYPDHFKHYKPLCMYVCMYMHVYVYVCMFLSVTYVYPDHFKPVHTPTYVCMCACMFA